MKQTGIRILAVGAMVIAGIFTMTSSGVASSNNNSVRVTANVQARISQTLVRQEKVLKITEEEIKRGYVDLPAATLLQVKSNDRNGYMLSFEVNGDFIKEAWVIDSNRTTSLSGGGGFVHQAYPGPSGETKELSYRLFLVPGTQAGLYAWPLSITASLP